MFKSLLSGVYSITCTRYPECRSGAFKEIIFFTEVFPITMINTKCSIRRVAKGGGVGGSIVELAAEEKCPPA